MIDPIPMPHHNAVLLSPKPVAKGQSFARLSELRSLLARLISSRTFGFYILSAAIGGLGWSGITSLSFLPLLYPVVYAESQTRREAASAFFYYLAATWLIIPGAKAFFGSNHSYAFCAALWLLASVIAALPWCALYSRRLSRLSAIAALMILAAPPFGLLALAYPLNAAGRWFPGTSWIGLAGFLLILGASGFLGRAFTAAILIAAAICVHLTYRKPIANPSIHAVGTDFGGPVFEGKPGLDLHQRCIAIQKIALAYPNSVVLLPELTLPAWSTAIDQAWAPFFHQLQRQHTTLLLGTSIPVPYTRADRNILITRGWGPHFAYVQRVPVPLGMWNIGDQAIGFPLMLGYPPTIRLPGQRAAVLICYEQLLPWTALQSLSRHPDLILAPSNEYWAAGTNIQAIQHQTVLNWADLWSIPLYEAMNK